MLKELLSKSVSIWQGLLTYWKLKMSNAYCDYLLTVCQELGKMLKYIILFIDFFITVTL